MISDKLQAWLGDEAKIEPTGDLKNGDYMTNLALMLAKKLNKKSVEIANELKSELEKTKPEEIEKIEVAGPGFINFYLTDKFLQQNLAEVLQKQDKFGWNENLEGKKVIVEYTDPNPFKEFHIGHLMSNAIGESISRLIEASGAEVKRACYQGDVGLHVAKAVWADGDYALGAKKYEEDEQAKLEIQEINKKLYAKSDLELNKKYESGRKLSLAKFEEIYKKLGTKFDFYFFESETGEFGKKIVQENLGKVFQQSDGAVIFPAEKYDEKLHTRVYITSQGLPTYEAKELGLHFTKAKLFPFDQSLIITANEQDGVFKVGLEALRQLDLNLANKTKHVSHGMLRLTSGKMSSRTGEVITAESLLEQVGEKVRERNADNADETIEQISIAAIKYAILKQAPGRDVIFDLEKSVSLEGDSGPYLQYTYARAKSLLTKANWQSGANQILENKVDEEKTEVEKWLARFPETLARAQQELAPQIIITYLLNLAGSFNSFYAQNKIIGSEAEKYRLNLTAAVAQVIKNGLWLLGIAAPEKM